MFQLYLVPAKHIKHILNLTISELSRLIYRKIVCHSVLGFLYCCLEPFDFIHQLPMFAVYRATKGAVRAFAFHITMFLSDSVKRPDNGLLICLVKKFLHIVRKNGINGFNENVHEIVWVEVAIKGQDSASLNLRICQINAEVHKPATSKAYAF